MHALLLLLTLAAPDPALSTHPWGQYLLWRADNWDQAYGQDETVAWQLTGKEAYRADAIRLLLTAPNLPANRNDTREGTIDLALQYEALKPYMTIEQRGTFEAKLKNWAEGMIGARGHEFGTRLGDSDEVVGHHFGVRLIDRACGTDYSQQPGLNGSGSVAEMREAIRGFIKLAEGGEWIEAGEKYNYGTLQLLLMGVKEFPGEYPEVEAWLPQCAQQLVWHVTSDNKDTVQWGDIEDPHGAALYQWVAVAAMLLAADADKTGDLRKAYLARTRGLEPRAYGYSLNRVIRVFDPRSIFDDGSALPNPQGLRVSKIGLVLYRKGDTLVQVLAPPKGQVDHYQSSTDFRVYDGGEWIVDHPLGYQMEPVNQAYAFGFPAMAGFQEMTEATETADGFVVGWRTGGVLRPPYQWSPPVFVDELSIRLEYMHATRSMAVECKLKGTPPERKPVNEGGFYQYELDRITRAKAPLEVIQHTPNEPSGLIWKTKGGRAMQIRTTAPSLVERIVKGGNLTGYIHDQELGGWLVRLTGDSQVSYTVGPAVTVPPVVTPEGPRVYRANGVEYRAYPDRLERVEVFPVED